MTKNFSINEFNCKCGCEMPYDVYSNIKKLADQLQILRDVIGKPIEITNAYRCVSHNIKVGGVSKSQHILGKAADIKVKGYKPKILSTLIDELIYGGRMLQGGIGVYKTFTHYDIRKTKARWDHQK